MTPCIQRILSGNGVRRALFDYFEIWLFWNKYMCLIVLTIIALVCKCVVVSVDVGLCVYVCVSVCGLRACVRTCVVKHLYEQDSLLLCD